MMQKQSRIPNYLLLVSHCRTLNFTENKAVPPGNLLAGRAGLKKQFWQSCFHLTCQQLSPLPSNTLAALPSYWWPSKVGRTGLSQFSSAFNTYGWELLQFSLWSGILLTEHNHYLSGALTASILSFVEAAHDHLLHPRSATLPSYLLISITSLSFHL